MSLNGCEAAVKAGGRHGARRPLAVVAIVLGLLPLEAAGSQEPSISVSEGSGGYTVHATFQVPEPAAIAVAALTDYAEIPRFMPEVRTSQILERSGAGVVVEQEAVARFLMFSKRIHLVLEVQHENGTIRFRDRCGKSFSRYEGTWKIAEQGGRTHITYELLARPSFEVPGFLLKRLLKRDASQMIERLQKEIAARRAASPARR